MLIQGHVTDKEGNPIEDAGVYVIDMDFELIKETSTDHAGHYIIDVDVDVLPHLAIVKGYKESALEFWGTRLCSDDSELVIDCQIDTIEVYQVNAFCIERGTMIFFRPFDLAKFDLERRVNSDVAPDIDWEATSITIDGRKEKIVNVNQVEEHLPDSEYPFTAYLVQTESAMSAGTHAVRIRLVSTQGHVGEALHHFAV